jgi:TPR repeat protein
MVESLCPCRHLGSCYLNADSPGTPSLGIPLDPEEAIKLWKRAVEAGSGAAAKLLGDLYLNRKILRLADADSGFAPNQIVALNGLSNSGLNGALGVVADTASQSPVLPERLAVRLILASQEIMQTHAKYFSEGLKVKVANLTRLTNAKDFGKAASYYKKGIELACNDNSGPECMVELAKLYEEGQGLEKSEDEAYKLLKMAVDAGFPPAFPRLAMCYYTGAGVKQDYSRCLELVSLQPALGESQLVLSFLHSEGHGVEKDDNKSLALLRESAQSCEMAMHILGNMHLSGQNVEQDYEQAFRYFKQASDLDFGE